MFDYVQSVNEESTMVAENVKSIEYANKQTHVTGKHDVQSAN